MTPTARVAADIDAMLLHALMDQVPIPGNPGPRARQSRRQKIFQPWSHDSRAGVDKSGSTG
jgi:hypothetical protein